jgi:hypothetical protein
MGSGEVGIILRLIEMKGFVARTGCLNELCNATGRSACQSVMKTGPKTNLKWKAR